MKMKSESIGGRNHVNMARNSEPKKTFHLLTREHSHKSKHNAAGALRLLVLKHSVYGKKLGYLPTSEAITVMLCQGMSSLSRGCVVRTTPLFSSILKYLSPSSLLSKKYLLGKEFMIGIPFHDGMHFSKSTGMEKMGYKRSLRWQWIICRLQGTVRWRCPVSMNFPDLQVETFRLILG